MKSKTASEKAKSKTASSDDPRRIVREPERAQVTGVPRSGWYPLMAQGLAPLPVPLGPRARGWVLGELFDWNDQRRALRDQQPRKSADGEIEL
jgi:prophage regulatory protein